LRIYVALDIFLLEFSPRLLLTAVDNYCELVFRVLSISFSLPLLVKLAYYENGALPPLEQLPSFARGNHDRFSENFAPWPGRAGHRILVFLRLFVSYRPLTARSRAEQVGARAVQAAPGNQGASYHYHLGRLPQPRVRTQSWR